MIKDASRSTVIIFAVIAVACIASGLAYTAMVINSDNSSSAEYGLVTISDGSDPATADDIYSKNVTMTYLDESAGDVVFEFDIYDISDSYVSADGSYVTVSLTSVSPIAGSTVSRSAYLSMSETSAGVTTLRVVFEPLTIAADTLYTYTLGITFGGSDASLTDIFDSKHITVRTYHLQEVSE